MSIEVIVSGILTLLFGVGGGGGIMYWILEKRGQEHSQKMDISDEFRKRLEMVEKDLEKTRNEVKEMREENSKLAFQVSVLINRVDMLVSRLERHEDLTNKEVDKLTSLPEYQDGKSDES